MTSAISVKDRLKKLPIVESIKNDNSFEQTWSKETKNWIPVHKEQEDR